MKDSSLDRARSGLYEPDAPETTTKKVHGKLVVGAAVPTAWEEPAQDLPQGKKPSTWSRSFLVFAACFFVASLGAAAYFAVFGGRTVSPENIRIEIDAPDIVSGGATAGFTVTVVNTNPVALREGTLLVSFPEGTRAADEAKTLLKKEKIDLGEIGSGGRKSYSIRAHFYGEEGEELLVPVSFSYKAEGSSATVEKTETHELLISDAPLAVSMRAPERIAPGEETELSFTVRTNTTSTLDDVAVSLAAPGGFTLTYSSKEPESGTLVFPLGTLKPGQETEFTVRGTFAGAPGEKRVITAEVGTRENGVLAVSYMKRQQEFLLAEPDLALTVDLSSGTEAGVIAPGTIVRGSIEWENNTEFQLLDATAEVVVSGIAIEPGSLDADRALVSPENGTARYSREFAPALRTLDPGEKGTLYFSFKTANAETLSGARAPRGDAKVVFTAKRDTGAASETLSLSRTASLSLSSALAVSARSLFRDAPFVNVGPLPPRVGSETLYGIEVSVKGGTNTIADLQVTLSLPTGVRYAQVASVSGVSYNEASREIVWKAGELAPGATAKGAFQVGFKPIAGQSGAPAVLVDSIRVNGFDRFTRTNVSSSAQAATTVISTDSAYAPGVEVVGN